MKFSLKFIKEFKDFRSSPEEIADLLTMVGLEIESFQKQDGDCVFSSEVTSNRYDWLSMFGIANELVAAKGAALKVKFPKLIKTKTFTKPGIHIENKEDCPVYIGQLIKSPRRCEMRA